MRLRPAGGPPPDLSHWWPLRQPEPAAHVLAVVQHGQSAEAMRWVRVSGGWHTRGYLAVHPDHTPPRRWSRVGRCWAQIEHPVVDATVTAVTSESGSPSLWARTAAEIAELRRDPRQVDRDEVTLLGVDVAHGSRQRQPSLIQTRALRPPETGRDVNGPRECTYAGRNLRGCTLAANVSAVLSGRVAEGDPALAHSV